MIWKIIGVVCSSTFFITGFSVLGDPNCVTEEIGGGRVIGVTCRPDTYGTWSGGAAASIMLFLGTALLTFVFWRELRNLISSVSPQRGGKSFHQAQNCHYRVQNTHGELRVAVRAKKQV